MKRVYQYRLYPNKSQAAALYAQLEIHRELYNRCLEVNTDSYYNHGESLNDFALIKKVVPDFKGRANYSAMQQTTRRLWKAFKAMFRKDNPNQGRPRFKGRGRFRTIEFARLGDGVQIKGDALYIQFVGHVPMHKHRDCPQPYKASITERAGKFYVSLCCDEFSDCAANFERTVGIDFGIRDTVTTSDGTKVQSPWFMKADQKDLARLRRRKNRKAVAKREAKIANRRKDFNHKLSRRLINQYDVLCLEDLRVSEFDEPGKAIRRRVRDVAITQLIGYLLYKAESAGKQIALVNPAYTSQDCSDCGVRIPKELSERNHTCTCGCVLDRDINAARNILRLGLQSLGLA